MDSLVATSYASLTNDQARVFRLLGLHSPEFGVPAVRVLCGLDTAATDHCLQALAARHLIEPSEHQRYRIHDATRAYAAHLADADEQPADREAAVTRLLAWYARTAQLADYAVYPALIGITPDRVRPVVTEDIAFADRGEALDWLCRERDNLVEATRHAVRREAHDLVIALAAATRFMSRREHPTAAVYVELVGWAITAAAQTSQQRALEALMHSLRGGGLHYLGRLDAAESDFQKELDIATQTEDQARQISGLSGLGWVQLARKRPTAAREFYMAALPLTRDVDDGFAEAIVLGQLSDISAQQGEFEQALDYTTKELVLRRRAGDQSGTAWAQHHLAQAHLGLGQFSIAVELCRQAASAYEELDEIGSNYGSVLVTLARALELSGDLPAAVEGFTKAVELLTHLGDPRADETRTQLAALLAAPKQDS